jgi:hypothetical protein
MLVFQRANKTCELRGEGLSFPSTPVSSVKHTPLSSWYTEIFRSFHFLSDVRDVLTSWGQNYILEITGEEGRKK